MLQCSPMMGKHHLTAPELAWIQAKLIAHNLSNSVDMIFLHDDDFHVTGDTIASTMYVCIRPPSVLDSRLRATQHCSFMMT
jgi:hypothetical protein